MTGKTDALHLILNKKIVSGVLDWYQQNHRDLPWRRDRDPYHIWISEIMLQQTRVAAVLDYYRRFLRELPDLWALAGVSEDRLMKLWEGLGYYNRARNLKKAAGVILDRFGGSFPETEEELLSLPGIGAYTAGAIGSICFGLPLPAVDGNVLRVISRIMADPSPIQQERTRAGVQQELRLVYQTLEKSKRSTLTQSLMELGATVCIPKGEPGCAGCPLNRICASHKEGTEQDYPVKLKQAARRKEEKTVFILISEGEGEIRTAIHRRPDTGLLSGLYEFPNLPGSRSLKQVLEHMENWDTGNAVPMMELPYTHIFSHVEWHMKGFLLKTDKCPEELSGIGRVQWVSLQKLQEDNALPSAFKPFLQLLQKTEFHEKHQR